MTTEIDWRAKLALDRAGAYERLEPDVSAPSGTRLVGENAITLSMAISLKRIADALEGILAEMPNEP